MGVSKGRNVKIKPRGDVKIGSSSKMSNVGNSDGAGNMSNEDLQNANLDGAIDQGSSSADGGQYMSGGKPSGGKQQEPHQEAAKMFQQQKAARRAENLEKLKSVLDSQDKKEAKSLKPGDVIIGSKGGKATVLKPGSEKIKTFAEQSKELADRLGPIENKVYMKAGGATPGDLRQRLDAVREARREAAAQGKLLTPAEQERIFNENVGKWANEVRDAVVKKLDEKLRPIYRTGTELYSDILDDDGNSAFDEAESFVNWGDGLSNGLIDASLSEIGQFRQDLGLGKHEPPAGVVEALKNQPLSQRFYALVGEDSGVDEDVINDDLKELFWDNVEDRGLDVDELESMVAEMDKKGTEDFVGLNKAEKLALYFYTNSPWTERVNNYMRDLQNGMEAVAQAEKEGRDSSVEKGRVEILMAAPAFEQTRKIATLMMNGLGKMIAKRQGRDAQPFMATRFTNGDLKDVKSGDVISDAGFLSTSDAKNVSGTNKFLLFTNQAADVSSISEFENEKEILVFPGTMFNVDMAIHKSSELGKDLSSKNQSSFVVREMVNGKPIDASKISRYDQSLETGRTWEGRKWEKDPMGRLVEAALEDPAKVIQWAKMGNYSLVNAVADMPSELGYDAENRWDELEEVLLDAPITPSASKHITKAPSITVNVINSYNRNIGNVDKLRKSLTSRQGLGDLDARALELLVASDDSTAKEMLWLAVEQGGKNANLEKALMSQWDRIGKNAKSKKSSAPSLPSGSLAARLAAAKREAAKDENDFGSEEREFVGEQVAEYVRLVGEENAPSSLREIAKKYNEWNKSLG